MRRKEGDDSIGDAGGGGGSKNPSLLSQLGAEDDEFPSDDDTDSSGTLLQRIILFGSPSSDSADAAEKPLARASSSVKNKRRRLANVDKPVKFPPAGSPPLKSKKSSRHAAGSPNLGEIERIRGEQTAALARIQAKADVASAAHAAGLAPTNTIIQVRRGGNE